MYGSYGNKRRYAKKGKKSYKNKGYSKYGSKKHGTKTVITKYKW